MVNKVLKVGDSAAVTIPKQVLLEMGLSVGDQVSLHYDPQQNELVLKPHRTSHPVISDRVARLTTRFIDRYRDALRKLA